MKKNGFVSNLTNRLRKWLGWCPEAPEPKGFRKFEGWFFTQFSIFGTRPVKIGLLTSLVIQIVTYIFATEAIITPITRILESQGRYYQGSYSDLGALFSIVLVVSLVLFVSSAIAGYMTGKVTSRLRQGFIVGSVSLLIGALVGIPISSYYWLLYPIPTINGGLTISGLIMSLIMTFLGFLFFGGVGGTIGQVLGRKTVLSCISPTDTHYDDNRKREI